MFEVLYSHFITFLETQTSYFGFQAIHVNYSVEKKSAC